MSLSIDEQKINRRNTSPIQKHGNRVSLKTINMELFTSIFLLFLTDSSTVAVLRDQIRVITWLPGGALRKDD
jgi:hypothetical protein